MLCPERLTEATWHTILRRICERQELARAVIVYVVRLASTNPAADNLSLDAPESDKGSRWNLMSGLTGFALPNDNY